MRAVGPAATRQWKDFYTVPAGLPSTAALFAAVPQGTNAGAVPTSTARPNIISNGSKIVVPEGYGLLLFQDGKITGFVAEPGGYEWRSDDINSKSIFAGDGIVSPLIMQSWERFKFGGQPGSQQAAFFVSLKELPDNRFGTQSEIYWDDGFLNTQVGAVTRGSYTLKIVDPILFVKNFVPASYLQPGRCSISPTGQRRRRQLFNEVVGSLAPAFSLYERSRQGQPHRKLQQDSIGFAKSLSAGGGERLPVEVRTAAWHRQDRHRLDRVRRQHPRAAEDRAARRRAVRRARQLQPAGQRRAGHPVGRRERRRGGPRWASAWPPA